MSGSTSHGGAAESVYAALSHHGVRQLALLVPLCLNRVALRS
jgi:hypothetical protein